MGLFIRQDDDRSELQRRLSAELQEKARKKTELENQPRPDGVDDSNYMKDFTGSSRFLGLWIAIAIVIVIGVIVWMLTTK